jgi:hypothetical protein
MRRMIIPGALALLALSFAYGCNDTANSDSSNYDTTQTPGGGARLDPRLDTSTTPGTISNENNANAGNQDTTGITRTGSDSLQK